MQVIQRLLALFGNHRRRQPLAASSNGVDHRIGHRSCPCEMWSTKKMARRMSLETLKASFRRRHRSALDRSSSADQLTRFKERLIEAYYPPPEVWSQRPINHENALVPLRRESGLISPRHEKRVDIHIPKRPQRWREKASQFGPWILSWFIGWWRFK